MNLWVSYDHHLVYSVPFLGKFSPELVGLATLLCVSTTLREMLIDRVWPCNDTSKCPCKALRSSVPSLEPYYLELVRFATVLRETFVRAIRIQMRGLRGHRYPTDTEQTPESLESRNNTDCK